MRIFLHINTQLKKRGVYLLQPYPHMARTIFGSGLVTIIAAILIASGYASYKIVSKGLHYIQVTFQNQQPQQTNEKKSLPKPIIKTEQAYRELLLHTTFPYKEQKIARISDGARQADFALLQTINRLNIEKDRVYIVLKEHRHKYPETYLFQRIKVFLEDDIETFLMSLQDNLEAWAESISLDHRENNTYLLSMNDTPTHEITIVPTNEAFIPAPDSEGPRLTIVIDDLGENFDTANTLLSLNFPVTLSILPYTTHAESIAIAAHESGREVLIHQPMEASQSPYISTGKGVITLSMSDKQISKILKENFAQIPYISGMNNHMGSRFTCNEKGNKAVCQTLAAEGLFALDSMTHTASLFHITAQKIGLASYKRTIFLDDGFHSEMSVLEKLKSAEQIARKNGHAIVIGHPHVETIAALKKWEKIRDETIHIIPLRYQEVPSETVKTTY